MGNPYLQSSAKDDPYPVLIVNVDPTHHALEMEILVSSQYVVSEFSAGMEALAALRSHCFDAVRCGKRMPDRGTGYQWTW